MLKIPRRIWRYARAVAPDVAKTPLDLLYAYRGRNVERLLLTVGYNRSGSSLLGALLTAHPEMVVSHELYLLQRLQDLRCVPTPSLKGRAVRLILERDREFQRLGRIAGSGYSYSMNSVSSMNSTNGLWQGRHTRLRLIGDKGSTNVARILGDRRVEELNQLRQRVRLPVRFLFTNRNPYDVVASRRIHTARASLARCPSRDYTPADSERVEVAEEDLRWFLGISENLSSVFATLPKEDVLPMRYEDFIASPREKLCEICAFLGVSRDERHLDECAAFTFPTPHQTRRKVRWTEDQTTQIAAAIAKYPWLAGYDFHT